ncbi:MAG TPA: hypothetical protein VGK56_01300, partial [Anaerolineales bacterium]
GQPLIERSIELTEKKHGSTYATLREVVELTNDYEIMATQDALQGRKASKLSCAKESHPE